MLIYKAFRKVRHLQNLTFSDPNSIKIWCLILDVIFPDFGAPWCQNCRFWDPLGVQLCTEWRSKSPKWHQKTAKKTYPGIQFCRLASKIVFGTLLGTISSDFLWILNPFSRIFSMFNQICGINLGHRLARHPELACCLIIKLNKKQRFIKRNVKNKCNQRTSSANIHSPPSRLWAHHCRILQKSNANC